jgi:hypothetical protein
LNDAFYHKNMPYFVNTVDNRFSRKGNLAVDEIPEILY